MLQTTPITLTQTNLLSNLSYFFIHIQKDLPQLTVGLVDVYHPDGLVHP